MPDRRILLLNPNQLTAYYWQKDTVQIEQRFRPDENGHADFRAYLAQHSNSLFYLLADLPDESFQQDTLPHVSGSDRKALLNRKINQYFFGTPFTLARSLGRNSEGRKDERFIFAALTRPQTLEPWLLAMQEIGAPLAGIYSPPLLLPQLLDKEKTAEARLILITLTGGGLRQSYFEHGLLRFSRLTPLATGTLEEAAVSAAGEAAKIHQYLVGQRLLARGQKVPVLCLASPNRFAILRASCVDTDELSFHISSINDAAEAAHLKTALPDSYSDLLLAHLLAKNVPAQQFADGLARQHYRRWQLRFSINALALITLALAGLFAVRTGFQIYLDKERIETAKLMSSTEKLRYDNLVMSLPAVPVSPDNLRTLIERWSELEQRSPDLAASLAPISHALQATPQVELTKLDWHLGPTPDDNKAGQANPGPAVNGSNANYIVIDIEAKLPGSLGPDRRTQSEIVDRFVSNIKLDAND
ncbi:MAG TPA: hypothetical protein VL381_08480, partial [Rhodocyclaceae bacterium]|nr:hypothetical protein [Rhodocyclaceae bacterium]